MEQPGTGQLLDRFRNINIWKNGERRAPHKPLLLLMSLAEIENSGSRLTPFAEIKPRLVRLLEEFGPASAKNTPQEPFCRLSNDGIWELSGDPAFVQSIAVSGSVSSRQLLDHNISGGFSEPVYRRLKADPQLRRQIAGLLLEEHFPDTLYHDLLAETGLDPEWLLSPAAAEQKRRRNPDFRNYVLKAYEFRCAVCGLDIRIGTMPVALEAAHIRWFNHNGPDDITNGVALCSLHHKLFDRGAFTIDPQYRMLVSGEANGHGGFEEVLMRWHGRRIALPYENSKAPARVFTEWHLRQVFRGRERRIW